MVTVKNNGEELQITEELARYYGHEDGEELQLYQFMVLRAIMNNIEQGEENEEEKD